MASLSRREMVLAVAVGSIVFLLINVAVLKLVTGTRSRLVADIATRQQELDNVNLMIGQSDAWKRRDEWINRNQPALENSAAAGYQLLESIKTMARDQGVLLEKPDLRPLETNAVATVVPVVIETKSTWPALVEFLRKLQTPERFLVVETASFTQDPSDATQMRGKFRVSRWFALSPAS